MKTCPRCGGKKWWHLSTGQIRCSSWGLTRKMSKNVWKKTHISTYWQGRLVDYFCLGVPHLSSKISGSLQSANHTKIIRNLREVIYQDIIKDLKPLSGEIKIDQTMFGGRKPGKRDCGVTRKWIVFGIYQRNGKVLTFPIHHVPKRQ